MDSRTIDLADKQTQDLETGIKVLTQENEE